MLQMLISDYTMQQKLSITPILLAGWLATGINAQELPDKQAVLEKLMLANRYFMEKCRAFQH
ncbi:MAG: hypothetical protein HGA26_08680 [Chlorobiaceae bacterium]|nr:hypothetical protein [Chlorobiaceae bacterium]